MSGSPRSAWVTCFDDASGSAWSGATSSAQEQSSGTARPDEATEPLEPRVPLVADALSEEPPGDWLPPPRAGDPVEEAHIYLGAPYLWGGMSEHGIDCSGLVHMAWRRLGRLVPRDAHEQEAAGVAVEEPRYGDLGTYGAEQTTHIAFWLGEGRILHAAGSRAVVEEEEPHHLREIRRRFVRLGASPDRSTSIELRT